VEEIIEIKMHTLSIVKMERTEMNQRALKRLAKEQDTIIYERVTAVLTLLSEMEMPYPKQLIYELESFVLRWPLKAALFVLYEAEESLTDSNEIYLYMIVSHVDHSTHFYVEPIYALKKLKNLL
jgi:competence CoiA-like predicted nuclease